MQFVQLRRIPAAGRGWMLEAALIKTGKNEKCSPLSATDEQVCPRCGRQTFRTGATLKFIPSEDQTHPLGVPGVDYEVAPIEYDEPDQDNITPLREWINQGNEKWNRSLNSLQILGFIFSIPAVLLIVSNDFFEIPNWVIVASVVYALVPALLNKLEKDRRRSNKEDAPARKPAR